MSLIVNIERATPRNPFMQLRHMRFTIPVPALLATALAIATMPILTTP